MQATHTDQPVISVIIVTWNNQDTICACLQSIQRYLNPAMIEVCVVDNASTDGTLDILKKFPTFYVIQNPENTVYAKANNQALQMSKGEWVLFLNPDTELTQDALTPLINRFGIFNNVGGMTCRLNFPDGRLQKFCRRFPHILFELFLSCSLDKKYPESALANGYHYGHWDFTGEMIIDQPPGAFLMVRRSILSALGGFDTDFPLFYNDVDLCRRIYHLGYVIWYSDEVSITHHQGGSLKHIPIKRHEELHKSKMDYFKKHHPKWMFAIKTFSPLNKAKETPKPSLKGDVLLIASCPASQLDSIIKNLFTLSPHVNLTLMIHEKHPFFMSQTSASEFEFKTFSENFMFPDTLGRSHEKLFKHYSHILVPTTTLDGFGYFNILACLPLRLNSTLILLNSQNRYFLTSSFRVILKAKLFYYLGKCLLFLNRYINLEPKTRVVLSQHP